jgi:pimeloyl-ACP methyl ester carboxylesterase
MKRVGLSFVFAVLAAPIFAETSDKNIASRTAGVDGVQLHYLTAGRGPTVILLHGYAETSRMWRPIIPLLAEKFTVIAPDLPGIGDSGIPADNSESVRERGIDMLSSASRIHALVRGEGESRRP